MSWWTMSSACCEGSSVYAPPCIKWRSDSGSVGRTTSAQLCVGSPPVGAFPPERLRGGDGKVQVGRAPQLKAVTLVGEEAEGNVKGELASEARGIDGHTKRGAKGVEGDGTCSSWMRFMDGWAGFDF